MKMGHFAEKIIPDLRKSLHPECKEHILHFSHFLKNTKMHLLPFAKVGQRLYRDDCG